MWYSRPLYKNRCGNFFEIICRGCSLRNRPTVLGGYISSISNTHNRLIDNSYLTFKEEPDNKFAPNAILVVVRGEVFGTIGYVGKEFTAKVKDVLNKCSNCRIDMVDKEELGKKEVRLVVHWM